MVSVRRFLILGASGAAFLMIVAVPNFAWAKTSYKILHTLGNCQTSRQSWD
jgi:hypothetical protein